MNKKIIIIISILLLLIIPLIYILTNNNKNIEKFYLTDNYYNNSQFIQIKSKEISNLNKDNYLLFTYNNYCTLPIPCEYIFEEFMKKYNISIVSMPFIEYKKTNYYKKIKYAPTIIIIKDGKIIDYLDANSNEDLNKYQNIEDFENWISKYIYLNNNQ